jgi:hypothetical protein
MLTRETHKISLTSSDVFPLCPWCETPLAVVHWHKVHAGPPLGYAVIFSCARCHGVLDSLAHTDHSAVIV